MGTIRSLRRHIPIGVGAAVFLVAFYLVIVTLAQDLEHALKQAGDLWYWLLALAGGFGIQAGLFSFIRQSFKQRQASATASIATSGGVSAGSMVACCAHHLSDVLPLIGVAGLATFLVNYQLFFIILGVVSNVVGITIMFETMQRHTLSLWVASWRWNMSLVRKGTMITAVFVLIIAAFCI